MNKPTEKVSNNSVPINSSSVNNYFTTSDTKNQLSNTRELIADLPPPSSYNLERYQLVSNNSIRNGLSTIDDTNHHHHALIASHSSHNVVSEYSILPSIHNSPFQHNENVAYSKPTYSNYPSNTSFYDSTPPINNMQERLPSIDHVVYHPPSSSTTIRNNSPPSKITASPHHQQQYQKNFNLLHYLEDHEHSQYMTTPLQVSNNNNNNQFKSIETSKVGVRSIVYSPPTHDSTLLRNSSKQSIQHASTNSSPSASEVSNNKNTTLMQSNSSTITTLHANVTSHQDNYFHDFYVPIKKANKNHVVPTTSTSHTSNFNNTQNVSNATIPTVILSPGSSNHASGGGSGSGSVPLKCSLCDRAITKRYWVRDCNVDVMKTFAKNEAIVGNSCCKACYTKARKIIKSQKPIIPSSGGENNGENNSQNDSSSNNVHNNILIQTTASSVKSGNSTPESQHGINFNLGHLENSPIAGEVLEELGFVLTSKQLTDQTPNYSSTKIGKDKKKYNLQVDRTEEDGEIVFNIKLKVNKDL